MIWQNAWFDQSSGLGAPELAFFKSGRQRRIVVTGQWQSPIRVEYRCTREWPSFPNRYATYSEKWPEFIEVRALGILVRFASLTTFGSWPANNTCTNSATGQYRCEQSVTVGEGLAFSQSATGQATFNYAVADLAVFTLDPAATYLMYADVEEWFEVTDPIVDSDGQGFPNFGGSATVDSVTGRGIRFFERLRPGGEIGATLGGLVPLFKAVPITQAISDELGDIVHGLDRRGQIFAENASGILTVTGTFAGLEAVADYNRTTSDSAFDARGGYLLTLTKGLAQSGSSYGYSWAAPDTQFDWRAEIYAGSETLADPYIVMVERRPGVIDSAVVEGTKVEHWVQKAWSAFAVLDGVTQPSLGFDDRSRIRHWIDGMSLAANGDPVADWRLQLRGRGWLAFTASHPEAPTLDDGSSTSGWSGSGVTVSAGVTLAVGASGGSATRSFAPGQVTESHRYLEIELRSLAVGNLPVAVGIDGKVWNLQTGEPDVWQTVRIDLCHPDSPSVDWDVKESRHPLKTNGRVADSEHWGVSLIESISFDNLTPGQTYQIRAIRLRRISNARLSFLPAFRHWLPRQEGQPQFIKPFLWSEVDGRIADVFGMAQIGGVPSWPTLSDLIARTASLGWSVNPGLAVGDGYHGNLREAETAWGGGVLPVTGSGVDRPGQDGLAVDARALWDEVEVFPGAGDVFWHASGAFGPNTGLFCAKTMRNQAWGLSLGESSPHFGDLVRYLADSGVRGSDTTDSRGVYKTGLPGGLESPEHSVEVGGQSGEPFLPRARMRHRRVWRGQGSAGAVAFDWHPAGVAVRASIGTGGAIRLAIKGNALTAIYATKTLPLAAASLAVRWDLGRALRLVIVTEEEGQIKERTSDDLGKNWSMATTLASGNVRFPGLFIHPDGRRFVYWIEDGAVNGVIRDRQGGVLQTVAAARSPVMDKGLAVGGLDQQGGRLAIELVTVESDAVVSSLSSDGISFI